MATRTELISEVLEDLGVLAIGQAASSEDSEKAISKYQFVHEMLQTDDLLPFSNTDAIPSEYVQPMVIATGAALAPAYRIPADFEASLNLARRMIRRVNKDYTGSGTTQFRDY